MTTATIKSAVTQSPRTLWVRNVTGSRFASNIGVRNSTKSTDFLDINLDQAGVDTLIAELAANAPVDPDATSPEVLANLTAYSDSDLRYRINATAKALLIRKLRADEKARAADAEKLEPANAKTQAILDARPAPGAYTLIAYGRTVDGNVIVTEDRRIFVEQLPVGNHRDMTSAADGTDGWEFIKAPLSNALINAANGLVDDLDTWLKLVTK